MVLITTEVSLFFILGPEPFTMLSLTLIFLPCHPPPPTTIHTHTPHSHTPIISTLLGVTSWYGSSGGLQICLEAYLAPRTHILSLDITTQFQSVNNSFKVLIIILLCADSILLSSSFSIKKLSRHYPCSIRISVKIYFLRFRTTIYHTYYNHVHSWRLQICFPGTKSA